MNIKRINIKVYFISFMLTVLSVGASFLSYGISIWVGASKPFPYYVTMLVFIFLCLLVYLLIWVGVLVIYSIELSFNACSIFGLIMTFVCLSNGMFSMTYFGLFLLGGGLSILLFFGCIGITKATCLLSRATVRRIKSWFVKKGEAK